MYSVSSRNLADIKYTPTTRVQPLSNDQIRLTIKRTALTSNNVTYALLGNHAKYHYFDFFPLDLKEEDEGVINVWAVALVLESDHQDIQSGQFYYGYFPLSGSGVVMKPTSSNDLGFYVKREGLADAYNHYLLLPKDKFYSPLYVNEMLIFRPLFATSWLLVDYMINTKNTTTIVISSASAKTSIAAAFLLHQRNLHRADQIYNSPETTIVGLTSMRNYKWVKSLGIYTEVYVYDDIEKKNIPSDFVYVDVSGSDEIRKRLVYHCGTSFKLIALGMTHLDELEPSNDTALSSVEKEFFFAPTWLAHKQKHDKGFSNHMIDDYWVFIKTVKTSSWCNIKKVSGVDEIMKEWKDLVNGKNSDPSCGIIVDMQEGILISHL